MSIKRAFIIHGWDGVPDDAWKPWLKEELEKESIKVIAPQLPGGQNPKLNEWLNVLSKEIGNPDKEDIFIGHSLGCMAICRYLEQLPINKKVGGCFFVSGFISSLGFKEIENFFVPRCDLSKVSSHSSFFIAINSDNDPYVPLAKAEEIRQKLNARLIIEHSQGHINEDSGTKILPSLLNAIKEYQNALA